MKKLITVLAISLLICGCGNKNNQNESNNNNGTPNNNVVDNNNNNTENSTNNGDNANNNSNTPTTPDNVSTPDGSEANPVAKIDRDNTTIPSNFDVTTITWSSNKLLKNLPEIKNGTLMGANVDGTRGIEVFYKDADYSYFENYIKTLDSSFKEIRPTELVSNGNYYISKRVSEEKGMKVWIYYFNTTKQVRVLAFKIGYFTEGGLTNEEINN